MRALLLVTLMLVPTALFAQDAPRQEQPPQTTQVAAPAPVVVYVPVPYVVFVPVAPVHHEHRVAAPVAPSPSQGIFAGRPATGIFAGQPATGIFVAPQPAR